MGTGTLLGIVDATIGDGITGAAGLMNGNIGDVITFGIVLAIVGAVIFGIYKIMTLGRAR